MYRDQIPGSKWWKFDFHTHSPASICYGRGPDQAALKAITPRQWLLGYMQAGIDCLVIADHNSGEWIDLLKQEYQAMQQKDSPAAGFRPLYLFPGAEITVHCGIHLLAILDLEKSGSDIDTLLGAVGYAGTRGDSDTVTRKTFCEVVDEIVARGGVAIPAHVDKPSGLFVKAEGMTLEQCLKPRHKDAIFAMELMDSSYKKPQIYIDEKLHWTEVLGSDAHHPSPSGLGNGETYPRARFTWVKMGEPSLEALRLALLDGPLSVVRSDDPNAPDNPNQHASRIIESINIAEARYCGRSSNSDGSNPFSVSLNPWLNAIIGGRGTGKSTVVEFMRTVLRREGELDDIEELKKSYDEFMSVAGARDDRGALTDDTRTELVYYSEGARFRLQWSQSGEAEPITELLEDGSERESQGDIRCRFPVRIYSQKQIFHLAQRPGALLRIIDDDPSVNRSEWEERWEREERHFFSLRAQAREIQAGLDEEGELNGALEDAKRILGVFESSGHGEILKNYQRARRQQRAIEEFESGFTDIPDRLRETREKLLPAELSGESFDAANEADKTMLEQANTTREAVEKALSSLNSLAAEMENLIQTWGKKRADSGWQKAATEAERKYAELKERLEAEGIDPNAYGQLVQQRQTLESRITAITGQRKHLEEIKRATTESLQRLLQLRRELTHKRTTFLSNILSKNAYVRMEVIPYGAKENAEDVFRDIIGRERPTFANDILSEDGQSGIFFELYEDYDASNANVFEDRLQKVKQAIVQIDRSIVKGEWFAKHLIGLRNDRPESFDRLWAWFPEDSLSVRYSPTGDGENFRPIEQGSPGQKTAAILAFLLAYGDEPMILDQPEDDLDNHLIYDLIVRQIRENKRERQIIVVTHNPNIVVNGDAELVIPMDSAQGQCKIKISPDGLQNRRIREEICRVMEGGREAFKSRYDRIVRGVTGV